MFVELYMDARRSLRRTRSRRNDDPLGDEGSFVIDENRDITKFVNLSYWAFF
jgi:hypothetical protein